MCTSRHNLFLNPGVWKLLWGGLAGYLLILVAFPEYFRRGTAVHYANPSLFLLIRKTMLWNCLSYSRDLELKFYIMEYFTDTIIARATTTSSIPNWGPTIIAVSLSLTSIALILVILRLGYRWRLAQLGWDDFFVVVAIVSFPSYLIQEGE
jgi:hypothetical protein